MIEWKVLEEALPEAEPPPRRSLSRGGSVLLTLVLLLAGAGLLRWRVQASEVALRADLRDALLQEERAWGGSGEQAAALADPTAPDFWLAAYRAAPPRGGEVPTIVTVTVQGTTALLLLQADGAEQEARAYRLVEGAWRRTPITEPLWGPLQPWEAAGLTLWLHPREEAQLEPGPLAEALATFQAQFSALWPEGSYGTTTIRLLPGEWQEAPRIRPTAAGPEIVARSPLVATSGREPLPPLPATRHRLAQSIAAAFSDGSPQGNVPARQLRLALREALVRALVLEEGERAMLRDAARAAATAPEPLLTDPTYRFFFGEFLVSEAGLAAPGRFLRAYSGSGGDMDVAARAAGLPRGVLEQGARRWMEHGVPPSRVAMGRE